jgi:hypothetical protein
MEAAVPADVRIRSSPIHETVLLRSNNDVPFCANPDLQESRRYRSAWQSAWMNAALSHCT